MFANGRGCLEVSGYLWDSSEIHGSCIFLVVRVASTKSTACESGAAGTSQQPNACVPSTAAAAVAVSVPADSFAAGPSAQEQRNTDPVATGMPVALEHASTSAASRLSKRGRLVPDYVRLNEGMMFSDYDASKIEERYSRCATFVTKCSVKDGCA
jgi:hypothetical protein